MNNIKILEANNLTLMSDCLNIRKKVFIEEQGVPEEIELDELDKSSFHAICFLNNHPVATGRLIKVSENHFQIGRMAVLKEYRRYGLGKAVIDFLENEAIETGAKTITLHAQEYVKNFYLKSGYYEKGNVFLEAGILHIEMYKNLTDY